MSVTDGFMSLCGGRLDVCDYKLKLKQENPPRRYLQFLLFTFFYFPLTCFSCFYCSLGFTTFPRITTFPVGVLRWCDLVRNCTAEWRWKWKCLKWLIENKSLKTIFWRCEVFFFFFCTESLKNSINKDSQTWEIQFNFFSDIKIHWTKKKQDLKICLKM